MKRAHRADLFAWSTFDAPRDLDFNSWLWVRPTGNVAIDPLPLSPHDLAHVERLGGVRTIVVSNSDHVRDAPGLAARFGAEVLAPRAERDQLPVAVNRWLGDGEQVVDGLVCFELDGSKTPGELALLLDETTLFTGDLVRGPEAGRLDLLPDGKLRSRDRALASVRRLAELPMVEAVLVGDGWPIFRDGRARLAELVARASGR